MSGNNSGWNRPAANQPTAKRNAKAPSQWRGVAAGLAIAVPVVALCLWLFSGGEDKPAPSAKLQAPSTIKEVAPAAAPVYKEEPKVEKEPDHSEEIRKRREMLKKMTPEEKAQYRIDLIKSRPPDLTPTTNHPFRTGTEIQMARIFTTELGDPPPPFFPMPIQDEVHLASILVSNNPALETDNEKVKDAKQMVELAKKEMREYLKEGGDPHEFLQYYHGKLTDAFQQRTMYAKEIVKVAKEDPDIALEFYEEANKKLAEKGIKPVKLNKQLKQRLGVED